MAAARASAESAVVLAPRPLPMRALADDLPGRSRDAHGGARAAAPVTHRPRTPSPESARAGKSCVAHPDVHLARHHISFCSLGVARDPQHIASLTRLGSSVLLRLRCPPTCVAARDGFVARLCVTTFRKQVGANARTGAPGGRRGRCLLDVEYKR